MPSDWQRIISLEKAVERIETTLNRLVHDLMGNGQPGEIAKIKEDIKILQETRWRLFGMAGLISILFQLIPLVRTIFPGK